MNFFLQGYRVLALVVACCVCNLPGAHTKPTGILIRGKRQSKEECTSSNQYWDSTTSSCESCQCPAGQRNTAELCGFGFIVGRYQCVDCQDGRFRRLSDHHSTCPQCTVCSPYATIVTNCTRTDDTQCICEKGSIGEHCVSCQDFPLAKNCSAEVVNTTPALNTVTAPHGGDDSNPNLDRESKSCQKKGVRIHLGWTIGIGFFALFIGLGSGIAISASKVWRSCSILLGNLAQGKVRNRQSNANDSSTSRASSITPVIIVQRENSLQDSTTPASASNGENHALVHQNGAATNPNGPSNSITANDSSTSREQPSSNSPFAGVQGATVFVPDESSA